ncbi:hypothetical protein F4777DRAFT_373496 [Nemania sp. FL0916]|nr:hypothetical protein F4777DRAFT_373496 [Nemania sp. FL0916]
MVVTAFSAKEMSKMALDQQLNEELVRGPAAVFEACGLSIYDDAILDHEITSPVDEDVLRDDIHEAARKLKQQAEERHVDLPRLYADFLAAFLTQRQQIEMIFVHTGVALREHRFPLDLGWVEVQKAMAWMNQRPVSDYDDLDLLIIRSGTRLDLRRIAPPLFVPARFEAYIETTFWMLLVMMDAMFSSEWGLAACRNYNVPRHRCSPLHQRWPVDHIRLPLLSILLG